jgi:hypothetical protein
MAGKQVLKRDAGEQLIEALKARFEKNMDRHSGVEWPDVLSSLESSPEKLWSIQEMERTGGEPDVVDCDGDTGGLIFCDCSTESPKGRRSVCYDREGLESRKEHRPQNNAIDMAAAMGIELLTEEQYRALQRLGNFDMKTSSWVKHLQVLESSAAPAFVIAVMARSSPTTTERSLTMPHEESAAC